MRLCKTGGNESHLLHWCFPASSEVAPQPEVPKKQGPPVTGQLDRGSGSATGRMAGRGVASTAQGGEGAPAGPCPVPLSPLPVAMEGIGVGVPPTSSGRKARASGTAHILTALLLTGINVLETKSLRFLNRLSRPGPVMVSHARSVNPRIQNKTKANLDSSFTAGVAQNHEDPVRATSGASLPWASGPWA